MSIVDQVYRYVEFMTADTKFQCDKNKEKGYRFYHSRLVANLCIYILENCLDNDIPKAERNEMALRKEIICIAALLHDIKKDKKHHAQEAADNLKNIFKEIALYTQNSEILNMESKDMLIIEDMIRKHGSHGSNNEFSKYYIRLIQDADNISSYVNYLPEEIFNNVFDIRKDKDIYFTSREKVKEKHKKLNYMLSKKILKII